MTSARHPVPPARRTAVWVFQLSLIAAPILSALPAKAASDASPTPLAIVERSITQDQGSWQLDYRLRHAGTSGIVVTPAEIVAKVDGWVSNSRVPSHAVPRLSTLALSGGSGLSANGDVLLSSDESQRCRERLILQIALGDASEFPPLALAKPSASASSSAAEPAPTFSLAPGELLRVRLRLEHQHFLYGDYDPLLGRRTLELHLGSAMLRDVVPMDREQYLAQSRFTWPQPPEDRRDTRHYVSAPDSLHLEAHIPGNQYYRFPERPVRYGTKMRLRFSYLIAAGTEGECRARVAQYKDTPTAWKVLGDGAHEECLTTVGRWVKVERIFRTESDATTLALDFRISSPTDVGEMWIDNVSLEPVSAAPAGP